MTRIPPLLTLLAVAVLGAGLFATNYLATPTAPTPLASGATEVVAAPAEPAVPAEPVAPGPVAAPAETVAPAEAPAPAQAAAPAAGTAYAGWTVGMGLTVAMTVVGDEVTAYVCDGGPVEVWLRGSVEDGVLDLSNADGATLTGTVDDSWAEGTVTSDGGAQLSFTAEPIEADVAAAAGRGDVAQVAERSGMEY